MIGGQFIDLSACSTVGLRRFVRRSWCLLFLPALTLPVGPVGTTPASAHVAASSPTARTSEQVGAVIAWADNDMGQSTPPPDTMSGVTRVAAGSTHTLAIRDGRVISWGDSRRGLADVPSAALTGVSDISAGYLYSLAVANGRVVAWGPSDRGETNVPPAAYSGATAVAAGYGFALALVQGGVVQWGNQQPGTLPERVRSGVDAIAAGDSHALALKDGEVIAWSSYPSEEVAVPLEARSGVSAIAAGRYFSLALKDGRVIAWGDRWSDGMNVSRDASSGVSAIAAGNNVGAAIKNGRVIAWGRTDYGNPTNVPASAQSGVFDVSIRDVHIVAVRAIDPPGAVTKLSIEPDYNSVHASWEPPQSSGGAPFLTYEYQVTGGSWVPTSNRFATIEGLAGGVPVAVSIRAVNGAGPGVPTTKTVTPMTPGVPGPVDDLRTKARGQDITVAWQEPTRTGGVEISGYEYRIDGGAWRRTDTATAYLPRMPWDTSVRIDVRAVNSFGPGEITSVWETPLRMASGKPDPSLPICGKGVDSSGFPTPKYGKKCRVPATLNATLIAGDYNVSFSQFDGRMRYWDFRVEGPTRDWWAFSTLFIRTSSGKLKEIDDWDYDNSDTHYLKYHTYVYPYRLGPGSYMMTNEFVLKATTQYTWIQTGERRGEYYPTRETRLTDKETLTFSVS